jgi:adenylate cyclase
MPDTELELTYLLKYLPADLAAYPFVEYLDLYIPADLEHPHLRVRKRGDVMEITKKVPIKGKDSSEQFEYTIPLNEGEFNSLVKVSGKKIRKFRYFYPVGEKTCEIDLFQDELLGLAEVDFEFKSVSEKNSFQPPDFCLANVTQEKTFAGGILAGKNYQDIEAELKKYAYIKLTFK